MARNKTGGGRGTNQYGVRGRSVGQQARSTVPASQTRRLEAQANALAQAAHSDAPAGGDDGDGPWEGDNDLERRARRSPSTMAANDTDGWEEYDDESGGGTSGSRRSFRSLFRRGV